MKIIYTECLYTSKNLLQLLGTYCNIQTMLKDADTEKIILPYLDCAVKFNGKWHSFCQYGQDDPNRKKWIREMSKLPLEKRRIPNDTMIIKCDDFESELFINLDGE